MCALSEALAVKLHMVIRDHGYNDEIYIYFIIAKAHDYKDELFTHFIIAKVHIMMGVSCCKSIFGLF